MTHPLPGIWSSRSATSTSGYTRSRGAAARVLTDGLADTEGSAMCCCWTAVGLPGAADGGTSSRVLDLRIRPARVL